MVKVLFSQTFGPPPFGIVDGKRDLDVIFPVLQSLADFLGLIGLHASQGDGRSLVGAGSHFDDIHQFCLFFCKGKLFELDILNLDFVPGF